MSKSIRSTADLARHLGLSRWSVSRAINGQDGVSAETIALVKAAMEKFAFTPSLHARGLRGRRTGVIGVCCRDLETRVTTQKIVRIQRLLSSRGYRPMLEFAEVDQRMAPAVMRHFIAMCVEGVVLVDMPLATESTGWQRLLNQRRIPVIQVEPLGTPEYNAVYVDREEALARLTGHLLDLGHEHLSLLGISANFPLGRPRYAGVLRALRTRGLRPESCLTVIDFPAQRHGGLRYGHELAERLITTKTRASALVALNDDVAVGVLWRLQKEGWACPRDFSLAGFDNLVLGEQTSPALTTVDHNVDAVVVAAVDMLTQLIERGPGTMLPSVKIEPRLVVRDSTAAALAAGR